MREYMCKKCSLTVQYDEPQAEYEHGFVCGICLDKVLKIKDTNNGSQPSPVRKQQ